MPQQELSASVLMLVFSTSSQICFKAFKNVSGYCAPEMAYLLFKDDISIDTQLNLIRSFNKELEKNRYQYNSLFLTNFRDNNRKRIGFDFAYKLINYVFKNIK